MEPNRQAFIKNCQELISPNLKKDFYVASQEVIDQQIEDGFGPDNLYFGGDIINLFNNKITITQIKDLREEIVLEVNNNRKVLSSSEMKPYLDEMKAFFEKVEEAIVLSNGYWVHAGMKCQNFTYNDLSKDLKSTISQGLFKLKELLRQDVVELRKNIAHVSGLSNEKTKQSHDPAVMKYKSFQIKNRSRLTEQNLKIVAEKLVNSKLVREVSWHQIRDLLNGVSMEDRIDWEKSMQSLYYFIYNLTNKPTPQMQNGVVNVTQNKWQIACSCFTYRGKDLSSKTLSHLKKPQASKVRKDIENIINDLL